MLESVLKVDGRALNDRGSSYLLHSASSHEQHAQGSDHAGTPFHSDVRRCNAGAQANRGSWLLSTD